MTTIGVEQCVLISLLQERLFAFLASEEVVRLKSKLFLSTENRSPKRVNLSDWGIEGSK